MRQVVLGKSGLKVSAVGIGGIPIQRVSRAEAVRTIRTGLDLGVNFIDTAAGYTDSQSKIGAAIQGRRDGLVIASKSGQRTRDAILADIERARQELGVDTIDLYQLHGVSSPESWETVSGPDGALAGLLAARDKGHIAHIGFSSHSLEVALKLATEKVFETIQFPFNLVTAEPADELIPLARKQELGFIVMKPLCGGQYDNAELAFKFQRLSRPGAHPRRGIPPAYPSDRRDCQLGRHLEGPREGQGPQDRRQPGQAVLPPLRILPALPPGRAHHQCDGV